MEITKTFVSKFNEGERVRWGTPDRKLNGVIIRVKVDESLGATGFWYLVELTDGERRWLFESWLRKID